VCLLDPDGDIVRRLRQTGQARPFKDWACYHTELDTFRLGSTRSVLSGGWSARHSPFWSPKSCLPAVASFCEPDGRRADRACRAPPYFVVIDRALRDEGTSYHYLPAAEFAEADPALVALSPRPWRKPACEAWWVELDHRRAVS